MFDSKAGRSKTKLGNYVEAQAGAGAHLSTSNMSTTDNSSRKLGHVKKRGIVSMSQQKPRDNRMYHISESSNLKKFDKALKVVTNKYNTFEHRLLSSSEIKSST